MTQRADDYAVLQGGEDTPQGVFEALAELENITIGSEGWSAVSFAEEAARDNGYVLYILCEGRAAALLTGYYAVGEGDITNVAVHPDFRRKGLAIRLISEFERLLPDDAEELFLEVRESNAPAIGLYEKCGFERLSVRKNFYTDPCENAVVMRKALK